MSFKDELKNSIKLGISEALSDALKTKSFEDTKNDSKFNSESVLEKNLGGIFQTLMATNPITLILEKNFKLTEKLFSSAKFAGNLTKNLLGNALKNNFRKKLGFENNQSNKALPNNLKSLQLTGTKILQLPNLNTLQLTSKNCLIKADKLTVISQFSRNNLSSTNLLKTSNIIPLNNQSNKALPDLQNAKLITAKSVKTIGTPIKLPNKNELNNLKLLGGMSKNILGLTKTAKNILGAVRLLAVPVLAIAAGIALLAGAWKLGNIFANARNKGKENQNFQESNEFHGNTKTYNDAINLGSKQSYRITSNYGWRIHPTTRKKSFHGGTDYAANEGTPIPSPFNGIVTKIWNDKTFGGGYSIKISETNSKGQRTGRAVGFAHLSAWATGIRVGTLVKKGQIIGFSGGVPGHPGAGESTGAHIHMSYYRDENKGIKDNPEKAKFGDDIGYQSVLLNVNRNPILSKKTTNTKSKYNNKPGNNNLTGSKKTVMTSGDNTKKLNSLDIQVKRAKDTLKNYRPANVIANQQKNIEEAKEQAKVKFKNWLGLDQQDLDLMNFEDVSTSAPTPQSSYSEVNKNELKAQDNSNKLNINKMAAQEQNDKVNKSLIANAAIQKISTPAQSSQSSTNIIYGITDNIDRLAAGGESLDIA